ncbi:MAG: sugar-binding transcriptional regulator [Actinomycetota bacterium]|nr:sugar-binding transcriptional regulator [Actinomycetota bacterium]
MTASADFSRLTGEQLRLMVRVARMYHEQGQRQTQIAEHLHISQTRVSRLLAQAQKVGVVRISVAVPTATHPDLEEGLEQAFGLAEAVVVDSPDDEPQLVRILGTALAGYLSSTLTGGDTVGLSSWSATLVAAVESMQVPHPGVVDRVVQIVGGVGESSTQADMNRTMARLADITGASAVYLPAPGMLESADALELLMSDRALATAAAAWQDLTVAIFGIGSLEPSELLRSSGNALSPGDLADMRRRGAVGDVCLRFYDEQGRHLASPVDRRVAGISAAALQAVPRRIGAAGGSRKYSAIRAAVTGGWVNTLITDVGTAQHLLADDPPPG